MASGGNGGKFVAGCSCLSMVFSLLLILAVTFGLATLGNLVPEVGPVQAQISMYGTYLSYGCCCLSGVGMIVGIVMLLTGGKGEDEA